RKCEKATPFVDVSEPTKCFSFAKFLELYFYPADAIIMEGAGCTHNIYEHHVRYFGWHGITVRFYSDPIVVHEVVFPPMLMRVKPETLLEFKNADYEHMLHRIFSWYTTLIEDLRTISFESMTGQKDVDDQLGNIVAGLIGRAEMERAELSRQTNRVYKETPATDTLGFGQVRALLQDRIVEWQKELGRLPKPRMISDKEKRMTAFNTVKGIWPRRSEPSVFDRQHLISSSVSEADEHRYLRRVTGDSILTQSSASETESTLEKSRSAEPTSDVEKEEANYLPDEPGRHEQSEASAAESDSTVGAKKRKRRAVPSSTVRSFPCSRGQLRLSRLPKRTNAHPTVAELVKRYQEVLPSGEYTNPRQSVIIGQGALSAYESDRDADQRPRITHRKAKGKGTQRRDSSADFDNGYAANIGTKYLASERKVPAAPAVLAPGPRRMAHTGAFSSSESRGPSRRTSPDKRAALGRSGIPAPVARLEASTSAAPRIPSAQAPTKSSKNKQKSPRPPSMMGRSTMRKAPATPGSKVSNLARQFERINKDNERANKRLTILRGKKARPVATARAKVEVFSNIEDAIRDMSDSSDSSSEADDEDDGHGEGHADDDTKPTSEQNDAIIPPVVVNEPSPKATPQEVQPEPLPETPVAGPVHLPDTKTATDVEEASPSKREHPQLSLDLPPYPPSPVLPPFFSDGRSTSPPASDIETTPGNERHSFMRALSGFWPPPLVGTPASGRRMRLDGGGDVDPVYIFRGSSIVVRTDEPTSIIAFTLDSQDYRNALAKSLLEQRNAQMSEGGESFMPDESSVAGDSTWGVINLDEVNPVDDIKYRTKSMVESLSRCVKWDASGGKSGSAFLKTRDDRFIAKELSKSEMEAVATFAPAYFDYMSAAIAAGRPTLLAKIFGFYRIAFRILVPGPKGARPTWKTKRMNMLVMENLFYDRKFTKIYDLKGSSRNRLVQSTGRENEVLLDENLVQTAHLNPLFVREHSKRILRSAIWNDTKFLADLNVMDYSLVVGVDSNKRELVVGIVGTSPWSGCLRNTS
ncbi:hypothetical protein EXIGLDRAFT_633621, partial [Exidia glandulosa HHB12029]